MKSAAPCPAPSTSVTNHDPMLVITPSSRWASPPARSRRPPAQPSPHLGLDAVSSRRDDIVGPSRSARWHRRPGDDRRPEIERRDEDKDRRDHMVSKDARLRRPPAVTTSRSNSGLNSTAKTMAQRSASRTRQHHDQSGPVRTASARRMPVRLIRASPVVAADLEPVVAMGLEAGRVFGRPALGLGHLDPGFDIVLRVIGMSETCRRVIVDSAMSSASWNWVTTGMNRR